jgi:hypothetical protein
MSITQRPFRVQLDKFHHLYSTKLGHLYAPFLCKQARLKAKGKVRILPTILMRQKRRAKGTDQVDKRIVDTLYQLRTKAKGERGYSNTVLQAEHQNRNQAWLNYRMFDYYNSLSQEYKDKDVIIEQILVYTGDEEFKSPTKLNHRKNKYSYPVVDLTQIDPSEVLKDPDFAIQFLSIFNKKIPDSEKVPFIVNGLHAYRLANGREATQILIDLIPLMMVKHNTGAIDAITKNLITDDEFHEMIKMSTFWTTVKEEFIEEGIEKGIEQGIEEGIEKGIEQGIKQGKVLTAVEIICGGIASLEALTQTLRLTSEEIAAIQAMIQQTSNGNGNGKNGLKAKNGKSGKKGKNGGKKSS